MDDALDGNASAIPSTPRSDGSRDEQSTADEAGVGNLSGTEMVFRLLTRVPAVVRSLHRRLGRGALDQDELEDVAQSALLAIWEKRTQFDHRRSIGAWAHGFCATELAKALARRRQGTQTVHSLELDLILDSRQRAEIGEDARLEVCSALARTGSLDAEVVLLKIYGELTFREIASRLGISPSSAKSRYYRCLERLRIRLRHLRPEVEDLTGEVRPYGRVPAPGDPARWRATWR